MATKREIIIRKLDNEIERSREYVASFHEEATKSVTHAMRWHGDAAMRHEALLGELLPCRKYIVDENIDDAKLTETLERECARIIDFLVGHGGAGPWSHSSTCAISNLHALAVCDAKRELLVFWRRLLDVLNDK